MKGKGMKKNSGDRIGLDFGTTYSVISQIKVDSNGHIGVEACKLNEGGASSEILDSIVLKDRNGELLFGTSARNKVGRSGFDTYTGFKMMLSETDENVLKQRFYDDKFTPRYIVSEYLDYLLNLYRNRTGKEDKEKIEKLVVGVPEIWFTSTLTIDCRTTLRDIIKNFTYVDDVEIVSEPAAACAYFVQNYLESTGTRYDGKILIVDYGGGTLDIALCEVKQHESSSDVKAIARAGAGWNTQGTVGKAGMAFMEEIVKIAFRQRGLSDADIVADNKFAACVKYIETELMANGRKIDTLFRMHDISDFSELEEIDTEFDSLEYRDNDYPVTYGMLAAAYNKVISSLLDEKLDEIIGYMESHGIDYSGGKKEDDFKIALVGGFCNFCLTERQIKEKFGYSTGDKRYKNIILDRSDCEKAISYGAALIANDVIEFKQVAPYSLGFASKSNPAEPWFAISKGDDIEFGKVKMFVGEDGEELLFRGDTIPLIAFNFEDDPSGVEAKDPLPEYQRKLNLEKGKIYKFGYSLDQSMIISLHKWIVPDVKKPDVVEDEVTIVLDEIYKMMGNLMVIKGGVRK